jgi:Raf kinase inhibitor-like YbhB/YbcL family protein
VRRTPFSTVLATAVAASSFASCGDEDGGTGSMAIRSPSFRHMGGIPARHSKEGGDVSPALEWSGVPAGTRELAVIMDDPTASSASPWVHWVVYGIPATATGLPEGVPVGKERLDAAPAGAIQGKNSWKTIGYTGPFPEGNKPHQYQLWVYAIDTPLPLGPGATAENVIDAMRGHVLGSGRMVGTFARGP